MENEAIIGPRGVPWERETIEKLLLAELRERRTARRWRMLRTLIWMGIVGALVWLLARDLVSTAATPSAPQE